MFRNQFFLVCFRGGNWRKRNLEFNFFFFVIVVGVV